MQVLGSPAEEDLVFISSDKARSYIKGLPFQPRVPFTKLYPSANPLAVDLLEKMLVFNPKKRITVQVRVVNPTVSILHLIACSNLSLYPTVCDPFSIPYRHAREEGGTNGSRVALRNPSHLRLVCELRNSVSTEGSIGEPLLNAVGHHQLNTARHSSTYDVLSSARFRRRRCGIRTWGACTTRAWSRRRRGTLSLTLRTTRSSKRRS